MHMHVTVICLAWFSPGSVLWLAYGAPLSPVRFVRARIELMYAAMSMPDAHHEQHS